MILYVRQLAWLHGRVPDSELVRMRLIKKQEDLDLPELGSLSYLIDLFEDAGIATSGKALSWAEIKAWQSLTLTPLAVWEARLIKEMSAAYMSAFRKYDQSSEDSPAIAYRCQNG